LRFSPNSIALQARYVTVVEDRPIMSIKYSLPVPVFHFWPKLTHLAALSLCDSWASCLRIAYGGVYVCRLSRHFADVAETRKKTSARSNSCSVVDDYYIVTVIKRQHNLACSVFSSA